MRYLYRSAIFLLTTIVFTMTYVLQDSYIGHGSYLKQIHSSSGLFPNGITLIWLASFPVSVCLWLGWVFFLQYVPWRKTVIPAKLPGQLVIRYVTRGINVEAIRLSVQTAFDVFDRAGLSHSIQIQVVSDTPIDLPAYANLIVVPSDFETPQKSLFKAKALYYAQLSHTLEAYQWVLYLDEESRITKSSLQGIAQYMDKHHHDLQPPIGQGPIVYTGGHWFWRGADALRLADDLGRFQLQYRLGIPIFGAHGSYLLLRGDVDKALPFDVGQENSLTEDTAWALHAWQRGYRFAWVNGFILEQPPDNLKDFLKQRQRWLSGMKLVVKSPKIQWPYKIAVSVYTYLWQISFASICMSVVILMWGLHPPTAVQIITDFSSAVYVAAYLIGNVVTSYITKRPWMIATTALYLVYGFLESLASLMALRKVSSFYVVKKPRVDRVLSMAPRENS